MSDYSGGLIERVLCDSGGDWGFERFCCRHFSKTEGIEYFPTSRSYDEGKDGRAITELANGRAFIIASRQQQYLQKKVLADMKKLVKRERRIARVAICLTGVRSEKERGEIERQAKRIRTGTTIRVYGITELVEGCQRFSEAFEDCFRHELDDARREIQFRDDKVDAKRLGFRVMLATVLNEESNKLRTEILKRLIVQSLSSPDGVSSEDLSQCVGDAIGANRPVHKLYLNDTIRLLSTSRIIRESDGYFYLTEEGRDQARSYEDQAAEAVIDGRGCVRKSISRFVKDLPDRDFNLIWETVRTGMIELFQMYGVEVVTFVEQLADQGRIQVLGMPETVYEGVQRIVQSLDTLGPQLSLCEEDHQNLIDNFLVALFDPDAQSRRWLSQLCAAYVCACTLGLHPDALKRLEAAVRNWDIFPDTHVLLSLLGSGEGDHASIVQLFTWWIQAQGSLLMCEPYLDEIVRHAKLAETSIDQFERQWRGTRSRRRAIPPDNNVFLRGAIVRFGENVSPRAARSHVQQFHHPGTNTAEKLKHVLTEHGLREVQPQTVAKELERKLYLEFRALRLRTERLSEIAKNNILARCSADAKALAFIASFRATQRHTGRSAVILTQSDCLRRVASKHQASFSLTSVCVDPGRLIFALSMMPGATLNLPIIEAALFGNVYGWETRRHERLTARLKREIATDDRYEYAATLADRVTKGLQEG